MMMGLLSPLTAVLPALPGQPSLQQRVPQPAQQSLGQSVQQSLPHLPFLQQSLPHCGLAASAAGTFSAAIARVLPSARLAAATIIHRNRRVIGRAS
jgi:hypothetical protein